jgi:hypothetical protein
MDHISSTMRALVRASGERARDNGEGKHNEIVGQEE